MELAPFLSRVARADPRHVRLAGFAVSIGGYLVAAWIIRWGIGTGQFDIPGGDSLIWDRVGDTLRSGGDVYALQVPLEDTFWYAPPWAVLFAVVSWLPWNLVYGAIVLLEVAALRYVAGSWLNVGFLCWFPLVTFEVLSGNFNLIIAAGICAAVRGDPRLATAMAFAKLSPGLAVEPRDWRRIVVAAVAMVAITLPWLDLWSRWILNLAWAYGHPVGMQVFPFAARAVPAVLLLAYWKPWSRALGVVLAIPAFYWISFVLMVAPLALWARPLWAKPADAASVARMDVADQLRPRRPQFVDGLGSVAPERARRHLLGVRLDR